MDKRDLFIKILIKYSNALPMKLLLTKRLIEKKKEMKESKNRRKNNKEYVYTNVIDTRRMICKYLFYWKSLMIVSLDITVSSCVLQNLQHYPI